MTNVKICGITNLADALAAARLGADALGFNFYPKSPRYISPAMAREIASNLRGGMKIVGVFVNADHSAVAKICEQAQLDAIQLHGDETPDLVETIRRHTDAEVIKAFRVSSAFRPQTILDYQADAVLLDALSSEAFGGTGRCIDWDIARSVRDLTAKLYLAGGLTPDNVVRAIRAVRPYAVDVASGVESEKGRKDPAKLAAFIRKAKRA